MRYAAENLVAAVCLRPGQGRSQAPPGMGTGNGRGDAALRSGAAPKDHRDTVTPHETGHNGSLSDGATQLDNIVLPGR